MEDEGPSHKKSKTEDLSFLNDAQRKLIQLCRDYLSNIPGTELKWIGFINAVVPCIYNKEKKSIMVARPLYIGGVLHEWGFTFLTRDEPGDTLVCHIQNEMLNINVKKMGEFAAEPTKCLRILMIDHFIISKLFSKEFCDKHREEILSSEIFVDSDYGITYDLLDKWFDTDEAKFALQSMIVKSALDSVQPPVSDESSIFEQSLIDSLDSEKKEGDGIVPEMTCYVCLERPVQTVVYPCKCASVCIKCSEKLKDTSAKNKCMKCQSIITQVENMISGEIRVLD